MSEDSNEKTGCSGVETLEPCERAEAPDNRIAPSAPRGEEGASVGGSSGYVSSIGGLAEFACGPGSGWLYFVNGSSPGYGCGSYILSGGENITWIYTCDLGNDL